MPSLNKMMVIGNLGSDVEMRFTPTGKPTSGFRVAANRKYKTNQGETKESTEWFSIVTWGKTAELCNQYLHKGSLIYAEGRMQTRSWDGTDGQKHYRTELVAERILFMDKFSGERPAGVPAEQTGGQAPNDDGDIAPEDIPF
jgi:single-strand DNA-binding protein